MQDVSEMEGLEQLLNNWGRVFNGRKVSSASESSTQLASLLSPTDSRDIRDVPNASQKNWNVT